MGTICVVKTKSGEASRIAVGNIRTHRARLGMTVTEMSEAMTEIGHPLPPISIHRLEDGNRRIDVDDLTALARLFKVSRESLLTEPECEACFDLPPAGFTCNVCQTHG